MEDSKICLNCGCDLPYESWDNPDNITVDTIKKATSSPKALGLSTDDVIARIVRTWAKVKDSDKQYRAARKQVALGDMIDRLMGWGMSKPSAVSQAPKLKDMTDVGKSK